MNEDRLLLELRHWLQEERVALPDAEEAGQRIAAQLPTVRRRRWWWRLSFRARTTQPLAAASTTEYQPSPVLATNGHTPTVIGRTQSMFSPVKAITAGAIVFAIGGAFLVAQPFQQQSSLPGAEVQPPPAPTAFSSTYTWSGRSNPGSTLENDDGTIVSAGVGWLFRSQESSDPRFAGPLVMTYTEIEYPDVGGSMSVGGYRIETDEGAWQQVPTGGVTFEEDYARWASGQIPPADNIQFWTFIGEGDYEGLTAVVQETWWPGGVDGLVQFDGYVVEGDLWEAPEPWVP